MLYTVYLELFIWHIYEQYVIFITLSADYIYSDYWVISWYIQYFIYDLYTHYTVRVHTKILLYAQSHLSFLPLYENVVSCTWYILCVIWEGCIDIWIKIKKGLLSSIQHNKRLIWFFILSYKTQYNLYPCHTYFMIILHGIVCNIY
jgi:hypothetical protein